MMKRGVIRASKVVGCFAPTFRNDRFARGPLVTNRFAPVDLGPLRMARLVQVDGDPYGACMPSATRAVRQQEMRGHQAEHLITRTSEEIVDESTKRR